MSSLKTLLGLACFSVVVNLGSLAVADGYHHGSLKDAPIAPLFSWQGAYVGIAGGFMSGRGSHSSTIIPVPVVELPQPDDGSYGLRGGLIGATLGYNLMYGPTLLGFETDYSGTWLKGDSDCSGNHCGGRLNGLATVRARLGYDFGQLVAYATAGAAFGRYEAFTDNGPGYSDTGWRVGWTVGGGVERLLSNAASIKLEYLYADFGTKDQFTIAGHTPEQIDLSAHIFRLGFNLKLSP